MRHQNRFASDTNYPEEGRPQSRWCRRRTGGGWDLEVLSAVVPNRPGTDPRGTEEPRGRAEWKKSDSQSI